MEVLEKEPVAFGRKVERTRGVYGRESSEGDEYLSVEYGVFKGGNVFFSSRCRLIKDKRAAALFLIVGIMRLVVVG